MPVNIGAKVEEAVYIAAGHLMVPSLEELWVVHLFQRLVECPRCCDIQLEALPFSGGDHQ